MPLLSVWFRSYLFGIRLQCLDHIPADLSSLVLGMPCFKTSETAAGLYEGEAGQLQGKSRAMQG